MPPGGCLISPCGRVLSHPARRPRHRVAACVQYRAAGLSRLSCVTDFRIATAFYPCGGAPLPIGRASFACWLFHPSTRCQHTRFHSGENHPRRAWFRNSVRSGTFFRSVRRCWVLRKLAKNGAFQCLSRDRGHAQLHPLVAGFRPPRPRLSGVPAWKKEEYPGGRNRTGLQLERVQSNAPAGGLQTASRPRWDAALFATRLRGVFMYVFSMPG